MENGSEGEGEGYIPLFETKEAKGKSAYRMFSISMFVGISMVWVYRIDHIVKPEEGEERWVWILMFLAEVWFGFYWVITQSVRWNRIYHYTFKDRLSHRYEDKLPDIDIFVCTADPIIEPPMMVVNTVLSVMAYNYPTEKLSVYVSDDGGSDLTFYALLEASEFSKHWLPFCKKFNIEPRSPAAYFSTTSSSYVDHKHLSPIKRLYEEMENRVQTAGKLGRIPEIVRKKHKGFYEWTSVLSHRDHQTILQVLIDSRDPKSIDITGGALPMLVYLAREKRPSQPHNFKAGALNALEIHEDLSNCAYIRIKRRIYGLKCTKVWLSCGPRKSVFQHGIQAESRRKIQIKLASRDQDPFKSPKGYTQCHGPVAQRWTSIESTHPRSAGWESASAGIPRVKIVATCPSFRGRLLQL